MAEAAFELLVGGAQGAFGIDAEMAAEIGDGEKQIADSAACFSGTVSFCSSAISSFNLGIDVIGGWPVEADLGGLGLQFDGARHGRQGHRHAVEDAGMHQHSSSRAP